MKAKKRLLLLLALVAVLAAVSAMYAYDTVEGRTRNVITTGKVEISINETSPDKAGMITGTVTAQGIEFDNVLPGQTASKLVTIRNDAEPCWLRVRVGVSVEPEPDDGSDPAELIVPSINGNKWTKNGDYYYYDNVLNTGDVTEPALFDSVLFAPEMGNAYVGSTVKLTVEAEAIQYKNNEVASATLAWGDGA